MCILIGGFLVGLGFRYVGRVQELLGVVYAFGIGIIVTIVGVVALLIEEGVVKFI